MKKRDFDNSKTFVFKTILLNNRLSVYKRYLQIAKDTGYKICSLQEFWADRSSNQKHFILRHDVDDLIPTTRKMFEIEKSQGVHSTYYFRWSTIDAKLIKDMLEAGFEVGLHYETVATYIREHNILKKEDLEISELQNILKEEIQKFKSEYNPNMVSCCSHGAQENRDLNVSSNILLENADYSEFGLQFEAYDKDMYEKCDIYHIMDCNVRNNFGFSYNSNPMDGILKEKQNIVFLAHPVHWEFNLRTWVINLLCFILGKNKYSTEREFRRIAK